MSERQRKVQEKWQLRRELWQNSAEEGVESGEWRKEKDEKFTKRQTKQRNIVRMTARRMSGGTPAV
jgi:hypothetical protein